MHTETNILEPLSVDWLKKQWTNAYKLKQDGVPLLGFTWYSLTDQVDWDTALREDNGRVNTLGLYDLDRKIRDVGKAYKHIIKQWSPVLEKKRIGGIVVVIVYAVTLPVNGKIVSKLLFWLK